MSFFSFAWLLHQNCYSQWSVIVMQEPCETGTDGCPVIAQAFIDETGQLTTASSISESFSEIVALPLVELWGIWIGSPRNVMVFLPIMGACWPEMHTPMSMDDPEGLGSGNWRPWFSFQTMQATDLLYLADIGRCCTLGNETCKLQKVDAVVCVQWVAKVCSQLEGIHHGVQDCIKR